ncbi:MAG: molybdenum cofactor biosynthesis protein MoaE [Pirellulaceae bacterium]|nr:molybdenum cofactor biosynthesis protein MoaE [Pirellulaceae bacterium]
MMSQENRFVALVDSTIDVVPLQSRLADPDVGAHGWFYGVTRRTTQTDDNTTTTTATLSYEAHPSMALAELELLADKAIAQFGLHRVVIVHRVGEVPIGQASVVVGCSSPHRVATFAALEWIMETLKKDVPIWKRECYVDGSTQWVHPIDDDSRNDGGST